MEFAIRMTCGRLFRSSDVPFWMTRICASASTPGTFALLTSPRFFPFRPWPGSRSPKRFGLFQSTMASSLGLTENWTLPRNGSLTTANRNNIPTSRHRRSASRNLIRRRIPDCAFRGDCRDVANRRTVLPRQTGSAMLFPVARRSAAQRRPPPHKNPATTLAFCKSSLISNPRKIR